jgi:cytochrome c oxidase subunit 1
MLRTTDPKDIAILYLVTSFAFFLIGGAMALLIRGELARPGQQFLSNEQYNRSYSAVAAHLGGTFRATASA